MYRTGNGQNGDELKYLLLLSLFFLVGCNDSMRTRAPLCPVGGCSEALTLSGGKLIAEISISVAFNKNYIYFENSDSSVDSDDNQKCEISAEQGKRFSYKISADKLLLKDGFNTLTLFRSGGISDDGLLNTWIMPATSTSDQIEMEFITDSILRIRKVCVNT